MQLLKHAHQKWIKFYFKEGSNLDQQILVIMSPIIGTSYILISHLHLLLLQITNKYLLLITKKIIVKT